MIELEDINYTQLLQCQRNWDTGKKITPEHIDLFLEIIKNPPQQQGESTFNCIVLTEDGIKDDLYKICSGSEIALTDKSRRQPQLLAQMTVVWTNNGNSSLHDFFAGFHSGILAQTANVLGYKTSFTRCGPFSDEAWYNFLDKHNIPKETNTEFIMALGIGFGRKDTPYNRDHSVPFLFHTHTPITSPEVVEK